MAGYDEQYTDYLHIPEGYKTRMVKLIGNNITNNKNKQNHLLQF